MKNGRVEPETDFGREEALALQEILHSPARRKETMGYLETAGFLFAVCCNPDMVKPSEWLPEILGKSYGDLAYLEEAQRTLELLMRLYDHINYGVLERHPALPWGCEVRADPLANMEDDAPLARWARGFAQGYGWLQESWPDDLTPGLDKGLGACLMVLTFFSGRGVAEEFWKESKSADFPFEKMAKTVQELLAPTLMAYADLGRSFYEASIAPPRRSKTRRPHAGRSRKKRRRP
jgi:yecA family protein